MLRIYSEARPAWLGALLMFGGCLKASAAAVVAAVAPREFEVSGGGLPQPCYGDSGGPAFTASPEAAASAEAAVVGVVSRGATAGDRCDAGAIYGRVDGTQAWIEQARSDARASGEDSRAGCSVADRATPPLRLGWAGVALAIVTAAGGGRPRPAQRHRKRSLSNHVEKGSS